MPKDLIREFADGHVGWYAPRGKYRCPAECRHVPSKVSKKGTSQ